MTLYKEIQTRFRFNDKFTLTVIGVHLRSVPDDEDRCTFREGQALVAANLVRDAVHDFVRTFFFVLYKLIK